MKVDRCIACGAIVPEGRQICVNCEKGITPVQGTPVRPIKSNKDNGKIISFSSLNKIKTSWKEKSDDPPIIRELNTNEKYLLIVGAGGFGRVVLEYADREYKCSFIDDYVDIGTKIDGVEVVGKTEHLPLLRDYKNLVVAIGDNRIRERIYKYAGSLNYSFPNIIAPTAYVSRKARIGSGCIILNNVVIQSGVNAGNGIILNPGVELHNDSSVDDYALIYTNSVVRTNAHIGKRAWIGSTITISTAEKILDDAVVDDNWIRSKAKTFEELWGEIVALQLLPEMAAIFMHKSLSKETKDLLVKCGKNARELANLLNRVINTINKGSVLSVDVLVQKELKRK